ncbi:hypothetical protein FALBO_16644 [Fusarium albosuccineum]|uniref:Uncharacterized protein n=1 Tax=Fusarium albosuccineum TaxID=1237068 RepID=A0A8H4NYM7_9HYPO|nr:hypothetical protein FALBO_16644 [Fusarium albosuccineum]
MSQTTQSDFHPGECPAPWIGDNPESGERRQYIKAFFAWKSPYEVHRYDELKKEAEKTTALALKKAGWKGKEVSGKYFAFMVDMIMWECFFERSRPNGPAWPWKTAPNIAVGYRETYSVCYDALRRLPDSELRFTVKSEDKPVEEDVEEEPVEEELLEEEPAENEPSAESVLGYKKAFLDKLHEQISDLSDRRPANSSDRGVYDEIHALVDRTRSQLCIEYGKQHMSTASLDPVPLDDREKIQFKDEIERLNGEVSKRDKVIEKLGKEKNEPDDGLFIQDDGSKRTPKKFRVFSTPAHLDGRKRPRPNTPLMLEET